MARPQKRGLDYFPLDTVLDMKFELIEAEFGLTGFAVIVKLLQKIYAEQGYYCEYTNEVALLFAKKIGLGGGAVSEIITASIKRGIFNVELFDKYSILASLGIQKRYFEAVSRRTITVENKYLLVSADLLTSNVNINRINADISSEIVCNNPTNKIKLNKSKEKKIILEETSQPCNSVDKTINEIISLYNEICVNLIPATGLFNSTRERAIVNLWNIYGDIKIFKQVFENANNSAFLAGNSQSKWKAGLDWLLKQDKFVSVYEGVHNSTQQDTTKNKEVKNSGINVHTKAPSGSNKPACKLDGITYL